MIEYVMPMFRPPSEGNSFIIQATVGCSHNTCTYCAMYREGVQKFRIRPFEEIKEIIDFASERDYSRRAFIADGNALVMPQKRFVKMLEYLNEKCPNIERVTSYANIGDILRKGVDNLKELKALGLQMVYIGFESGDEETLKRIKKGATVEQHVVACKMLKEAGIMNSAMVLLGVAGVERSLEHGKATGELLTATDPEYVGVLSLQVRPGAPLYQEQMEGKFKLPEKYQMIKELELIVENTTLTDGHFFVNHISNYLPIKARFPQDKEEVLKKIRRVLEERDDTALRPDYYRDVINQY